jgi:transketolase
MVSLFLVPLKEFQRIRAADIDKGKKLRLIGDMCRMNTLMIVKRAGSGHLGSSFSAMDIVVSLYFDEMNTTAIGFDNDDRDIYFSSKGHDVPGLYSVLFALGVISKERFLKLRRLGGLDGHPDVGVPGIESNSGSLGMGISKARGIAWAKRFLHRQGRVFVMTGDGELQEGQNYEALQAAVHQRVTNLSIIVDHNKVQSDKPVKEIVDLGDLVSKLRCFGWHVARCDGHDFSQLKSVWTEFKEIQDKPKALIADTIKGKGISFMEHPQALKDGKGYYKWHAGAPDDQSFLMAYDEIVSRVEHHIASLGLAPIVLEQIESHDASIVRNSLGEPISVGAGPVRAQAQQSKESLLSPNISAEYVVEAYGKALVEIAAHRPDFVVLDADLAADCRIRQFELTYPERFIQCGIAEQDMVSMAGGLARQGLLPVVNSFASFLASRANEQIYNNASEKTKVIYVCHYAGLIPAGPGKSHQSIRDISLLSSLPNIVILEPCNAEETRQVVKYCIDEATENCAIRLVIGPSPRKIVLPETYRLMKGQGVVLQEGADGVLFTYGPVMLHEALTAAEFLKRDNFGLRVVNMPWLNRVDVDWLSKIIVGIPHIYVLEDHSPIGGLSDCLLNSLVQTQLIQGRTFSSFAVAGYPACGTPAEVLRYHKLDGESLALRITQTTFPSAVNSKQDFVEVELTKIQRHVPS